MLKRLLIIAAVASAIVLVACHPLRHAWRFHSGRSMTVGARLICPDRQGHLTLISATPDGRACHYRGGRNELVDLTLTPLNGQTPAAALAPTEAALRALLPAENTPAATPAPGASDDEDDDDHAKADPAPFVHTNADDGQGRDRAKVDLPFVHVDADDDKAHVKLFGVTIDADNDNANVQTNWGSKSAEIKAGPGGAEIRTASMGHGSVDLVYILANDRPGRDGDHTVGYLAQGPAAGPLVVGTFKSKARQDQHFHDRDLDQLMGLNVHS